MRKFTKSLLALALLVSMGSLSVYAQEEVHATFESPTGITWDAEAKTFSWTSQYGNQLHNIGLPSGNMTAYEKLVVDCDIIEGDGYRFMFYATTKGTTAGGLTVITESGKHEYVLSELGMEADYLTNCSEICLSGYNAAGKVKVNDVYLVKSSDPLAGAKELLSNAIAKGKQQNAFAKTTDSWTALQTAISEGEAEYASPTDESTLTAKTNAITSAIAGLKLQDGYVNLTKAMFHEWSGIEDDATITGTGGCDLVIGNVANGGMLYGNASVVWNQYAKLVNAKSLIVLGSPVGITFGARTDRLEVGNGGGDANGGSLTTIDLKIDEEGKATADLSSKPSVRINAIKNGWSGPANVTDLMVEYKPIAVAVGAAGYATFSSELNTKVAGTKAYAAKINSNKVVLTEVTEIPAGAGVIVETKGDYEFPVLNEAAAIAENDLLVSNGTVVGDGTIYVLANKNSVPGFYKLANDEKVPAGKAYLKITTPAPEFLPFEGGVTGIETVKAAKANNEIFNLAGQRVAKTAKGLYIVNGKKVVVK